MSERSTLSELFEKFNDSSVTQENTRNKCRTAWRALIGMLGPQFEAEAVTGEHIDRFQRTLRDATVRRTGTGYSEHSIFSYISALSQVFRWAADCGYVRANPVATCHRMRATKKKVHIYSRDEITDILDTVRGNRDKRIMALGWPDGAGVLRWTGFILVALTGPRIGEIWNLRWDDIALEEGLIRLQARPDRAGEYWRWGTKGRNERQVPMSDDLWALLCRFRTVAPWRYPFLKRRTCESMQARIGQLTEAQRKYPYHNFHRELQLILEVTNARRIAAHAEPIHEGKFHTLRKNAATQLAEQGVPSHFCQEILGHATDRLTKEVYTFVDQRKCLDESRRAFNAASY